jgi:daunorubicin C-13 ketoreductase
MPRTVVITGASSGIGLAAAVQFAAHGDRVVLVGRDPARLANAVAQVRAVSDGVEPAHFRADFAVLDDVRRLATELLAAYPSIDVLANNAGGMVRSYRRTVDGFEATLQSNHLAPFLLTHLLLDPLRGGRVVNTASMAHRTGNPDPDDLTGSSRGYSGWLAYGASKAANILFTAEAARRWPDVDSVAFHPGVVRTNFGDGMITRLTWRFTPFLATAEKAGALLVWLATLPADELVRGGYYVGRRVTRPARAAADPVVAAKLWDASTKAVGL